MRYPYVMPAPNKRKYAHVDWVAIRQLVQQGLTLKQISEATGIKRNTLMARSTREHWNVMAIRAGLRLPRDSSRAIPEPRPDAHLVAIKNGITLPLVKLARFYQNADLDLLRNDTAKFIAFVNASLKLLSLDDPKLSDRSKTTVNLQVLASIPASPVPAQPGQVLEVVASQPVPAEGSP